MRILWTNTARMHLWAIYGYIAQHSPGYAKRVVDRLTRRSQQIAQFPLSGRVVSAVDRKQIREIVEGPYRIIYFIGQTTIDILAVIHGSQNFWKE